MKRCCLFLAALLFSHSAALAVPTVNDPNLTVVQLTSGLSSPTTMAFIGANDILVLQKDNGQVRRVLNGVLQSSPVLDLDVNSDSERGLLGIALHPNFSTNHLVYLYFTESTGADGDPPAFNRVVRYTWDGSNLVDQEPIINLPATPGGPNHDGGIILFGPDGKLYIVIGDLNRNGQLQNNSNSGADPPDDTSVILRLNDDGSTPGDNPFSGSAGFEKYFAYGIRNSFGMAFDPMSGKLWITHNGPSSFDEIDLVDAGFNSGWNKIMGPDSLDPQNQSDLYQIPGSHSADPKFSWRNTVGPTGIAFLDSTALGAQHENQNFVGDVNNGNLYRFPLNGARDGFVLTGGLADKVADNAAELKQVIFGTGFGGITDLKVGPDGFLYVVSIGGGAIYVIRPAGPTFGVSSLPNGEVGLAYDVDLNIGGGTPPYVVAVIKNKLPDGLLDPVGESLSGFPTAAGTKFFTLQVNDADQASTTKKYKIKVVKAVNITTNKVKVGKVNKPYRATLRANRGKKPFTWSHTGTLPAGTILNPATGKITGTPLAAENTDVTFQVTDALGATDEKPLTITIN
jgi:glucose/arabinose dehydrogenase